MGSFEDFGLIRDLVERVLRIVTPQTGIAFQHSDGSSGRRYIVETVASGMAGSDYDGDGLGVFAGDYDNGGRPDL